MLLGYPARALLCECRKGSDATERPGVFILHKLARRKGHHCLEVMVIDVGVG